MRAAMMFGRIDTIEHGWCLRLNRVCNRPALRNLFVVVSRLGDGLFWYSLIALLPVIYGAEGVLPAVRMALAGAAGYGIYRCLKSRLVRERPYVALIGVVAGTPPLDRYSFPSGHTLHATSLSILALSAFPEFAWICVPFAILVALSRVVLGLHYPTDVAAGALIGAALAWGTLIIIP
jgi:undecaprenyl-diphosphatase